MNSTKQPLGIIFDMDGVLVDSTSAHAEAFRRTLAARGHAFDDYSAIAGLRTEEAFRRLLGQGADDALVRECVVEKRSHFRSITGETAPLMANAVETVRALASRSMTLGLATSGSRASMRAFLDVSALEKVFSVTLCGDDVRAAKPAPDLYLRAFAEAHLEPHRGLVVEDSAAGWQAATTAGAQCVLFRPSEDTRARYGDRSRAVIEDLGQLLDIIAEDDR